MNKVVFLIDGFNVYHSLVDAQRDAKGSPTKWLNLKNLCTSYLPIVRQISNEKASLEQIYYFSAPPNYSYKKRIDRYNLYIKCLKEHGIITELARFKAKDTFCPNCKSYFVKHEEKETDVAIATRLFEVCKKDEADTIILMTGDTDLSPAVISCKKLYPDKYIFFAFPYKRTNVELAKISPESFSIKLRSYRHNQFPDPLKLPNDTVIQKPVKWKIETELWKQKPYFKKLNIKMVNKKEDGIQIINFSFVHKKEYFIGEAKEDRNEINIEKIKNS